MKIYYESSLWYTREKSKKEAEECSLKQKINWSFEYLGQKCYVPYIYCFKEGIIFDIITPVADEGLQAFLEKHNAADLEDEYEARRLEEEQPYQQVDIAKVWINGEIGNHGPSSTACLFSPIQNEDENYNKFKKAYSEILKDEIHFGIERVKVPYPKSAEGVEKFKMGDVIDSLKFETCEVDKAYPLKKKFKLSATQPTCQIEMVHPVTKEKYIISFEIGEQESWELKEKQFYTTTATYEINPPIEGSESLDFDNSISYKAQSKSKNKYEPEATNGASIGIIGGADGPTAFFVTGKAEKTSCFSKITFEAQEEAEFELKQIYITVVPRQIYKYERQV